jgi:hypothetical protein
MAIVANGNNFKSITNMEEKGEREGRNTNKKFMGKHIIGP